MKGDITVTDLHGGIIFVANIWLVLMLCIFEGRIGFPPTRARVFIDGNEIERPACFDDEQDE